MRTRGQLGTSGPSISRRAFLLAAAAAALYGQRTEAAVLLLRASHLALLRQALQAPQGPLAAERKRLEADAHSALARGPWSVTTERPKNTPAGPNDYFSEGPYWWPDPTNPSSPYLHRDGEVNPNRFTRNHDDLRSLSETVLCLATAAVLMDENRYAQRVWQLLRVWFVDEGTRMTPHLEFGQAIRGRVWGRGIGLIDTTPFIWLVQGVMLLESSAMGDPATAGELRRWFRDFLRWMTTSEKGLEERDHGNNHSTWWAAQVVAYATFVKDDTALLRAWTLFYESILPKQFLPGGSAPKEEARTRSLSYSAMNLDGLAILCRIGQMWELDLWDFEAGNGASITKAVEYLLPFAETPSTWTKQQISPFPRDRFLFPALAGWGLGKPEWVEAQKRLGCEGPEFCRWVRMLIALPPMIQ